VNPPIDPDSGAGAGRNAFPRVIATLVCVHASMAATRVTATLLVLHQGYPEWVVGVLMSLFAVAPIALSLWAGRLADSHGLHKPLGVGVTLGGLGAGLAVISQHPVALAVAALATGGAISVAAVGIQREAGMLARNGKDLKRVFSWVALGPAVSNAVAPVAVGLLIDHVGFRAGFAFAALLPLLAWQIARALPRLKPVRAVAVLSAPQLTALSLLKLPAFTSLLLVNIALSSCWDAHSFAVPVLGHAREMSASAIGLVLGAFAVAATLVRLAISRFADHLQEALALRWAMGVATGVCAVYYWLPGPTGMLVGSALLGLALGSVQPMILALLHQVTPTERHGQALGLRMMATNAITIVMPLTFGGLATVSGVGAAPMWLMGSMVLLAQWPARRMPRTTLD
jgi:MFS family permease